MLKLSHLECRQFYLLIGSNLKPPNPRSFPLTGNLIKMPAYVPSSFDWF